MKQILKDHLFPKTETRAQQKMKGLDSLKKCQLREKAEEHGAHVTEHMTNANLKLSIRKAILQKTPPEAGDYMGFGAHAPKTYRQVQSQHPSYAKWVLETASQCGDSSWELKRFASWLNSQEAVAPVAPSGADVSDAAQQRGDPRVPKRRTVDATEQMEQETVKEALEKQLQNQRNEDQNAQRQILGLLEAMTGRLQRLEEVQAQATGAASSAGETTRSYEVVPPEQKDGPEGA
eukprot:10179901-Lingulodinium_polyedra.AAC.1